MNWEAAAAIGQLLGSIAVLVTLVYLAQQIRHAKDETQRQVRQSRMDTLIGLQLHLAKPEIADAHCKAQAALGAGQIPFITTLIESGLTEGEAMRLFMTQMAWLNYRGHTIRHLHELPPSSRENFDHTLRVLYGTPGVARLFYTSFKANYDADAVGYIDRCLARPD